MYSDILHPTDGSDGADAALETARDLAEKYGATVHVLHVVDPSTVGWGIADDLHDTENTGMVGDPEGGAVGMIGEQETGSQILEQKTDHAEEIVEQAASELSGVDVETAVEYGQPHEVILDYADGKADCIVMGTHGRTGLERYLLGSVTEKVVRLSDVPVVTVRETPDSGGEKP